MHILQPKHVKLSPKEANLLLEKLNIAPAQLPKIKKSDPALSADAKVGDIIKIERKSPESPKGTAIYFRVVIP